MDSWTASTGGLWDSSTPAVEARRQVSPVGHSPSGPCFRAVRKPAHSLAVRRSHLPDDLAIRIEKRSAKDR